jgi:hypothetical protein
MHKTDRNLNLALSVLEKHHYVTLTLQLPGGVVTTPLDFLNAIIFPRRFFSIASVYLWLLIFTPFGAKFPKKFTPT